ncbi:MAG: DUF4391 domain-containing protein [Gemmatimonadetes bacterium]|nr:DUF4391 domain-containing protein [Gemmatimonadota bacterium]
MNAADLIEALDLPAGARVDQRVPKMLLQEHAPTAADRRRIREGIEEVRWVAALKPTTIGVPPFRDEEREYPEIAVLTATSRGDANAARLVELIHRTIPYPVVLVSGDAEDLTLSLGTGAGRAAKRERRNRRKRLAVVDGIRYQRLGDEQFYAQELFEPEELTWYLKNLLDPDKGVYEQVVYDSDTERTFADAACSLRT